MADKLDNAKAFGEWFAGAFLPLKDFLSDAKTQAERRAATDAYMTNRGIAYAAWEAGRTFEREDVKDGARQFVDLVFHTVTSEMADLPNEKQIQIVSEISKGLLKISEERKKSG